MNNGPTPEDWEKLRKEVAENGGLRDKVITVDMRDPCNRPMSPLIAKELLRQDILRQGPDKLTVPQVQPLVVEYLATPGNEAGGHFHIVLEDDNVSDADIRHCMDSARLDGDHAGVELGAALLRLSKTQRGKIRSRC